MTLIKVLTLVLVVEFFFYSIGWLIDKVGRQWWGYDPDDGSLTTEVRWLAKSTYHIPLYGAALLSVFLWGTPVEALVALLWFGGILAECSWNLWKDRENIGDALSDIRENWRCPEAWL